MIKVKIPAYESYRNGVRPAVFTSLRQMLEYMDIGTNHKIYFNGEAEVSKLLGGEYNDKRGADTGTDYGFDNKIFVELERDAGEYNDDLDGLTGDGTVPPVWVCPITGARITPKFNTKKLRVTVNHYYKDRTTAQRNWNNIRAKTLGIRHQSLFECETHYPLIYAPMECYKAIFDRLITAGQLPADKDFIDWMFENTCNSSPAIIRNIVGNNPAFVFKQRIAEVGINMENPSNAYVNKGSYIGKYEVSWSYWFYWSEHTEWIFEYPMQIYQQPMPLKFIPENFTQNRYDYASNRFYESAVAQRVWDYAKNQDPFYHVLPDMDDYRPPVVSWVSNQLQVMVGMEDVENQVILNITDIQGFDWNPTVLHYLLKYHDKVTTRHKNPLQIHVWSDDTQVLEEQVILDANGDLRLTRKPRMASIYRVTMAFDYALRRYDEDAIADITTDIDFGKWIITILFPQYPIPPDFGENGWIDWWDVHNTVEVGDGDPLYPFPNGMLGSLIIGHPTESYAQYKSLMQKGTIDGTDYYRPNTGTYS